MRLFERSRYFGCVVAHRRFHDLHIEALAPLYVGRCCAVRTHARTHAHRYVRMHALKACASCARVERRLLFKRNEERRYPPPSASAHGETQRVKIECRRLYERIHASLRCVMARVMCVFAHLLQLLPFSADCMRFLI
jgi:hypothetical protein